MTDNDRGNGWNEYSRLVLKSLDDLSENVKENRVSFKRDIKELRIYFQKQIKEMNDEVIKLKVTAAKQGGKWGVIAGLITSIIFGIIIAIFKGYL